MAVYRVARTGNFTVMANYHLRDKNLTLKAKGLLSLILSLPEKWTFSIKGLARICKEGVDAIRAALQELKSAGYIIYTRVRNAMGQLKDAEYVIYERPQPAQQEAQEEKTEEKEEETVSEPDEEAPVFSLPVLAEPTQDEPVLENPTLGNPAQINNNNISNTDYSLPVSVTPKRERDKKLNEKNPYPSNPYLNPCPARTQPEPIRKDRTEGSLPMAFSSRYGMLTPMDERRVNEKRADLKHRICYDALSADFGQEQVDEVVNIMMEVLTSTCGQMQVAGKKVPSALVRQQFSLMGKEHIEEVFNCLNNTHTVIKNPKAYIITCLFNASMTLNLHMGAKGRATVFQMEEQKKQRESDLAIEAFVDYVDKNDPTFWEKVKPDMRRAMYGIAC